MLAHCSLPPRSLPCRTLRAVPGELSSEAFRSVAVFLQPGGFGEVGERPARDSGPGKTLYQRPARVLEAKVSSHGREKGEGTEGKEGKEQKEGNLEKPRAFPGLGEEACWVRNHRRLYVLKGDAFLRISVGGRHRL